MSLHLFQRSNRAMNHETSQHLGSSRTKAVQHQPLCEALLLPLLLFAPTDLRAEGDGVLLFLIFELNRDKYCTLTEMSLYPR